MSPGDSEGLADETARAYADAELSLLGKIASFVGLDLSSDTWSADRRNQAGPLRRAMIRLLGSLFTRGRRAASRATAEAERRGVAQADADLGNRTDGLPPPPRVDLGNARLAQDLQRAERAVADNSLTAYHRIITEVSQAVSNGTTTRKQAATRALARFADAGITGFRDRAGRNWELATYVEMAVRTHTANVMIEAHLARLAQAGVTLVMVSQAPFECPVCAPWEGKVLEVGGPSGPHTVKVKQGGRTHTVQVSGSLAEARSAGLFHPNCRHDISGYTPGHTTPPVKPPTGGVTYKDVQRQRALERAARKWDRRRAVALDDDQRRAAEARFQAYRARIREHVERTGLPRKSNRERHDAVR